LRLRHIVSVLGIGAIAGLALAFGIAGSTPIKAAVIAAPPEAYEGPRVTLRYMIWGRESEVRQEREKLEMFVERNPDIEVRLIQTGGAHYQVKLATMLAGAVAPDVFMLHDAMFPTLAEKKLVMPLDDRVAHDPDVDLDEFFARVVEQCRYKGVLYKLPVSFSTVALFYNRDMFDQAGLAYPDASWTWEDMLHAARRLTVRDRDGRPVQYGIMNIGPWLTYCMMIWQNGGELFDTDGHLVIGRPEYVDLNAEALQFCADLQLKDKVQPTEAAIETLPADPFAAGRVAMTLNGTWVLNRLRGQRDFDWDIAHPPRRKERASLVFGGSPVINSRSEHPDEAWRLLKAMTSDWWQERLGREVRSMPARRSVALGLRIPGIAEDVHLDRIFQIVEYARSQPIGPEVSEWMETPIWHLRDRILLGSIAGDEIQEALLAMQKRFQCPYCSSLH
jgi:multiple sugar transport system substrate-binding protein